MKIKNKGFTIIELMIAIAIIGVLAAIAVPAYSSYMRRAKVSEAFAMMPTFRHSVVECFTMNGVSEDGTLNTPDDDDHNVVRKGCYSGQYGIQPSQQGKYGIIAAVGHGNIAYKFNTPEAGDLNGGVILFAFDDEGHTANDSTTIPFKFLCLNIPARNGTTILKPSDFPTSANCITKYFPTGDPSDDVYKK